MNFASTGLHPDDFSSTGSSMFSSGAPRSACYSKSQRKRSDSKNHTSHLERNHFLESTDEPSQLEEQNRVRFSQREISEMIKTFAHARFGKKNERMSSKYVEIAAKMYVTPALTSIGLKTRTCAVR